MLQREQGWALNGHTPDIWEMKKTSQGYWCVRIWSSYTFNLTVRESFINRISGASQIEEPPPFFGGIIADPMGLGKTLSMIALIATDFKGYHCGNFAVHSSINEDVSNKTTLVIVPPPGSYLLIPYYVDILTSYQVLDSWEEQLSQWVLFIVPLSTPTLIGWYRLTQVGMLWNLVWHGAVIIASLVWPKSLK